MAQGSQEEGTSGHERSGRGRLFGIPLGELGLFSSLLIGAATAFAAFFAGTFLGIVEKIPYLKDLGVTAVELLPVFDFDETAVLREVNGRAVTNYWGYSTVGFFAPQSAYCVSPEIGSHLREFRDMVKALHRAGIGVILDVVFNHTDEGNHLGPTFSFRGIDNRNRYLLVPGICNITWTSRGAETRSIATIQSRRS